MSDNDFAVIENVLAGVLADGLPQAHEALNRIQARLSALEAEKEAATGLWGNVALGDAVDQVYRLQTRLSAAEKSLQMEQETIGRREADLERAEEVVEAANKTLAELERATNSGSGAIAAYRDQYKGIPVDWASLQRVLIGARKELAAAIRRGQLAEAKDKEGEVT